MLARSQLNSIGSKLSEAPMNNEISHEGVIAIANEERNYNELKESIRMMKGQGSDIEENKKIGIH